MSILFNRIVEVTFGVPGQLSAVISKLKVTFNIEKNNESNPNSGKIDIFNMNSENRALLERVSPKAGSGESPNQSKGIVILEAGYETTSEIIATGNITKSVTKKQGPDFVSSIEFGDGQDKFQTAKINKTFAPGVTAQQIIDALVDSLGLDEGDVADIPNVTFLKGMSLSGQSKDHMDEITKKLGLSWSIQNGALQIITETGITFSSAVLLSPTTGLVGEPNVTDKGIEAVSLLQPKIIPGRSISIKSKNIDGNYRVNRVVHNGDTHGNNWFSEIEAKEII